MKMGRGTAGKRGIGSGKSGHKTSTSKPASNPGFKTTKGDGKSGKGGGKKY